LEALPLFGLGGCPFRLLKYEDNAVFSVGGPDHARFVLRVSLAANAGAAEVESEMLWLEALGCDTGIRLPQPRHTRDGSLVASFEGATCCLMTWVQGTILRKRLSPETTAEAAALTARLHEQALAWTPPPG